MYKLISPEEKEFELSYGKYIRESDKNVKLISKCLADDYFVNIYKIIVRYFFVVFLLAFFIITVLDIDEFLKQNIYYNYIIVSLLIAIPILSLSFYNRFGKGSFVEINFSSNGIEIKSKRNPKKDSIFIESSNISFIQAKPIILNYKTNLKGFALVCDLKFSINLPKTKNPVREIKLCNYIEYGYFYSLNIISKEILDVLRGNEITRDTVKNDNLSLSDDSEENNCGEYDFEKDNIEEDNFKENNIEVKNFEENNEERKFKYLFNEFNLDDKVKCKVDSDKIFINLGSGKHFLYPNGSNLFITLITYVFTILFMLFFATSILFFIEFPSYLTLSASHIPHEAFPFEASCLSVVLTIIFFIISLRMVISTEASILFTINAGGIEAKTDKGSIFIKKYDIKDLYIKETGIKYIKYDLILDCNKDISLSPIRKCSSKKFILLKEISEYNIEKIEFLLMNVKKIFGEEGEEQEVEIY